MDEMAGKGFCPFCGQAVFIETVGELPQKELDEMAAQKCMCSQAQSERRKKERKKKIDEYVKKHFDPELRQLIYAVIPMVEQSDLVKFSCVLPDDRTVTMWMDSDEYLRIRVKTTSEEDLKV